MSFIGDFSGLAGARTAVWMNFMKSELREALERHGIENDLRHSARGERMLNITRDTGEFLSVLIRSTNAREILEIGTSNGYSTLWLAEAAEATGGRVTTLELSSYKAGLARENFRLSELDDRITLVEGEAGSYLATAEPESVDLIFLDSERAQYPGWWPDLRRILRPGGLLVVDNATSHPEDMAPFAALVREDTSFTTCLVPVGKGEFMAVKEAVPLVG